MVAPDVGGGFGSKIFHYAEEAFVTFAAKVVGRPVKWTSTRSEAFISDAHGRDHVTKIELATDEDGKFLALRTDTLANMGAYLSTFAPCTPTYLHGTLMAGNYATPLIYVNVKAVFTNTVPVDAYRGAGRPGGDLPDRARHRQGGARARDRPGGDPAEELREARPVPLPDAGRGALRHRRLRRHHGQAGGDLRPRRLPRPPRGERGEGQAARLRRRLLHRGLRHRALAASSARSAPAPASTRARRCG